MFSQSYVHYHLIMILGICRFYCPGFLKKNSSPPKPIKIVTQSLFARARKSIRIKSSYHMWLLHVHIWQYKLIKNHFSFTFRNLQINDNLCTGCTCNCLTMVRCEHSLRNTCTYLLVYR